MALPERKVYKLVDGQTPVTITSSYTLTGRKDLTVPTGYGMDGISGRISCIRLYGDAHDPAAKDIFITVTLNQAGTQVWLNEITAPITHAPIGTGVEWGATVSIEHIGKITATDTAEGTISVFVKTDSATATLKDCHFLWEY